MAKVLFADDSITVRKVAERLLTGAGLEVTFASSGGEALAVLARERPDVIISDVLMPDKSGYEVCSFVRSHSAIADTPVLLISGIVNEDVTREAESCRADGVLKKPFQGALLQERVLALLAKRQPAEGPSSSAEAAPSVAPPPAADTAKAVPAAAPQAPASSKVYRITEEQLQAFRQAASRIKELEGLLAQERGRSVRTAGPTESAAAQAEIEKLQSLLAQERQMVTQLQAKAEALEREAEEGQALRQAPARIRELEELLERERARAAQSHRASEPMGHEAQLAKLEGLLAQERQTSAQLHAKLEELSRAASEQGRADARLSGLESLLEQERQATARLRDRIAELEQAAEAAQKRGDHLGQTLIEIGRLAERARTDATADRTT